MANNYIKESNGKAYFNYNGEMVFYVPEMYFNSKYGYIYGEEVEVFGLFTYAIFDSTGKQKEYKRFNYPTMIRCKPSNITKNKLELKDLKGEREYRLLHFKKGDEVLCETNIPQNIDNAVKLLNLLIRAHVPDNIPYQDIPFLIEESANINGFSYGLIYQMFGILVSELYRDPKDLYKPYRLGSHTSDTDYKALPITMVPKYISPYTAITSENADEAVAAALLMDKGIHSPLEDVVMN